MKWSFGFLFGKRETVEEKAKRLRAKALSDDLRTIKRLYLAASKAGCSLFHVHPNSLTRGLHDDPAVEELYNALSCELPSLKCKVVEKTTPEMVVANPEEVYRYLQMGFEPAFIRRYTREQVTRKWLEVKISFPQVDNEAKS